MPSTTVLHSAPSDTVRRLSLAIWGAYATGEGAIEVETAAQRAGLPIGADLRLAVEVLVRRGHVMELAGGRLAWVATPGDVTARQSLAAKANVL